MLINLKLAFLLNMAPTVVFLSKSIWTSFKESYEVFLWLPRVHCTATSIIGLRQKFQFEFVVYFARKQELKTFELSFRISSALSLLLLFLLNVKQKRFALPFLIR